LSNNTNSKDQKRAIINALRAHPEGLTLKDIAEIVGHHRHTITKYVYELIGAQVIYQRDVGAAKLCYLRESYNGNNIKESLKNRKAQAQLIALFLLLVLVPTSVIVAQTVTNTTAGLEGMATAAGTGLPDDNLTGETPTDFHDTLPGDAPEGETAPEVSASAGAADEADQSIAQEANETGEEPEEVGEPVEEATELPASEDNVTSDETVNETATGIPEANETANEANVSETKTTEIPAPETNETVIEENVTETNLIAPVLEEGNATVKENITIEENVTEEPEEPQEAELSIEIVSPDRITRGEIFALQAVIENSGAPAGNVVLEWILPEHIEITEGSATAEIGSLEQGSSYSAEITVTIRADSGLGPNEIRVRVSYE
jgi:hypothetical protein